MEKSLINLSQKRRCGCFQAMRNKNGDLGKEKPLCSYGKLYNQVKELSVLPRGKDSSESRL